MPEVIEKRLVGEVISVEVSTLRQRLLINRGGNSGVYKAQPVITGDGVLGQVYRIGPFSSEIILITDAEHALPVQVLRSGVRTIALGTGRATSLELPYVPQNYDVKVGDLLVTSGLGQVFPYGLPVARVTKVERDPTQPLAQIFAAPLASIEADREVLFIWARPGHPAAPASTEALAVEHRKLRRRGRRHRNLPHASPRPRRPPLRNRLQWRRRHLSRRQRHPRKCLPIRLQSRQRAASERQQSPCRSACRSACRSDSSTRRGATAMNFARREPRWAVTFTVLLALILQVLPLPHWLARACAPRSSRWWSSTGASSRRTPAASSRPGSSGWRSTYSMATCSGRTRWRSRWWRTSR